MLKTKGTISYLNFLEKNLAQNFKLNILPYSDIHLTNMLYHFFNKAQPAIHLITEYKGSFLAQICMY